MKLSITNKQELKSAQRHAEWAREMIDRIKSKTEKRNQFSNDLDSLYKLSWILNDELLKFMDKIEVTIGGK